MKLLLIRHSKTIQDKDVNSLLWKLSDEGIQLCETLAKTDQIRSCKVIYSSLQTKALETTLILTKHNYIPIKTHADLTETTSVTNGYFDNFEAEVKKWHAGNYRILEGETKEESLARFKKAIKQIITENSNLDKIGIVSHGNILASYIAEYLNGDSFEIHQGLKMPDIFEIEYHD